MPYEQHHTNVFRMNDSHAGVSQTGGCKTAERCRELRSQRCTATKHYCHANRRYGTE